MERKLGIVAACHIRIREGTIYPYGKTYYWCMKKTQTKKLQRGDLVLANTAKGKLPVLITSVFQQKPEDIEKPNRFIVCRLQKRNPICLPDSIA